MRWIKAGGHPEAIWRTYGELPAFPTGRQGFGDGTGIGRNMGTGRDLRTIGIPALDFDLLGTGLPIKDV